MDGTWGERVGRWATVRPLVLAFGCCGLAVLAPASASAIGPMQVRDGRAAYDQATAASGEARVSKDRQRAAAELADDLGSLGTVDLDPVTGTARNVARIDGFLTGPSEGDPAAIALDYVRAHKDVFGLDADDLTALRLKRRYSDVLGTTHLVWAQTAGGVSTLDSGLRAAVSKRGRLINVQGAPVPDLALRSTEPRLDASEAVAAARADAGVRKAPDGKSPRLTIYASPNGPRLAWRLRVRRSSTQIYDYVIDAKNGEVLRRDNAVEFATGLAWDYFPGPIPLNSSGVATSRDFTAPAWLASNATTLSGNNTHVYFDLLDDNTPAAGDEVPPSSGSNWNYSLSRFNDDSFFVNCSINFPCSWDSFTANSWQTNMRQNATQLFYFVNRWHDWLSAPPIGFTEAAGNFQVTNSSGQGLGGDAVQAQALDGANTDSGFPDGSHFNTSSMVTRADGTPPRLVASLASALGPNGGDVNLGDDASIVYHELTHGLSSRLVTDNAGNPALLSNQSQAMGEGWSDWYAMDFLVAQGFDVDNAEVGDVNFGYYVAGGPGLRSQPLDCPVDSTDDPCVNFNGAGNGGYTYGDYGAVAGGPEVHSDGEIWGQTLWELRQRLIAKYGAAAGRQRAETYVTRAMELSPPNPSFVDMRNAILQAETVATAAGGPFAGSDDNDVLWQTFANRGLGYFAGTLDGDDVAPIANFSLPPAPGAPKGNLHGTVTLADGGAPAAGVRVSIGGHGSGFPSDLAATTNASGAYTISNVPNGTYPYVFADGPGYDRVVASNVTVGGSTARNLVVRRNWAEADGGATVQSFSPPDLSGNGCGPGGAIDGSQATGWGSTSPTSSTGPGGAKQITIRLPQAITLSQYAVDPGATCGDDDNASVGQYRIETSANGTTFTQTNAGTFTATNNHKLNLLAPSGGTTGVRYVRFTMLGTQGSSGSGADWMDMSELKVFGVAAGDTTRPRAKPPATQYREGAALGGDTTGDSLPVHIVWARGSDDVTDPDALRYRLQRRVDGGPFTNLTGFQAKRTADVDLAPGHDYRFRVQARDEAGNASRPVLGPEFSTAVRQENAASLNYGAGWLARTARATAYGGFLRPTATVNAVVNSPFSGRAVAVVMPRASNLGTAQICLTDLTAASPAACQTVDLSPSTGTGVRKLVYEEHGLDPSHSYRVSVKDTAGRIELDALALMQ